MKDSPLPSRRGAGRRIPSPGLTHLPMEWMDPMSWRLPSGKDLAEFALQSGFLAPLMLGGPTLKRKKVAPVAVPRVVDQQSREGPDRSGTFRETERLVGEQRFEK